MNKKYIYIYIYINLINDSIVKVIFVEVAKQQNTTFHEPMMVKIRKQQADGPQNEVKIYKLDVLCHHGDTLQWWKIKRTEFSINHNNGQNDSIQRTHQ